MPLNRSKGRMFRSVGWTWCVIEGCSHDCVYCWAKRWRSPRFKRRWLKDKFPRDGTWIFVSSTGDIMSPIIPDGWIKEVLKKIRRDGQGNRFLLQSKNPMRFQAFLDLLKPRDLFILGTTIETNRDTRKWSKAPPPWIRVQAMYELKGYDKFLSLEPLADFDLKELVDMIGIIEPVAIEIGLENYTNYLPKPTKGKCLKLIDAIRDMGIKIQIKDSMKRYLNKLLSRC